MADEPSASVAQATQAHECNGAREGSSCIPLSESGAAINDGATERLCQPTTFSSEATDLGLKSAQASALTKPPSTSADSPYSAALPVSSAPLRIVPITPGPDHPGGVRYEVSYRWNGEQEGDPTQERKVRHAMKQMLHSEQAKAKLSNYTFATSTFVHHEQRDASGRTWDAMKKLFRGRVVTERRYHCCLETTALFTQY